LELNRFGKKVEADRWIFSRDKLLAYYQDLLDEPARLAKVFDSLKPLYDENRRITGYVLGVEGEGDFFKAVGLREGDIVRSVNSLEMTSRRRAEYFIREFVGNRLNIFVLDVQRKEGPQKLIYEVR
jgi:type II secretory pathway component PulC